MNRFRRMQSYYYVDNTDGRIVNPAVNALRDYTITGTATNAVGDYDAESGKYKIPVQNIRNLFLEDKMLEKSQYISKTDDGYKVLGYPVVFDANTEIVKYLKSNLKPGITYTIDRYFSGYVRNAQGQVALIGPGGVEYVKALPFDGYRSTTFTLTQEQIDNLTYVFVYGANKEDTEKKQTFKYIRIYDPTETETTDIILDAPVNPGESINKINDSLPEIKLHGGINMLTVQTEVSPSAVNWQYYKY